MPAALPGRLDKRRAPGLKCVAMTKNAPASEPVFAAVPPAAAAAVPSASAALSSRDGIRPAKLADAVADHLERLILEGALRPGEKLLPERELAERLNVSRPSLREALDKLAGRGLVRSERGGGTYIAELVEGAFTTPLAELLQAHPAAAYDYLDFRCVVEGEAARLAALRGTDVDRDVLTRRFLAVEQAHGETDPSGEAAADADFHLAIYEMAHNLVLLHIMRGFSAMLRNDVFYNRNRLYSRQGVRELLLSQHRSIYDAVMTGDGDAAAAAATRHIRFTRSALQEINEADARLEASLRRIDGGGVAAG